MRSGLRLRILKNVNPDVRKACIDFSRWLRKEYGFPIRLVIYIKPNYRIINNNGESVVATFFAPYDKNVEPYIRVATGDYNELLLDIGKDNALASILRPIAHELVHYRQWLDDVPFNERKANLYSRKIMDKYFETKEHL